jgi:alkylation response protein AidB-like acyl-CoA dehydrogenase
VPESLALVGRSASSLPQIARVAKAAAARSAREVVEGSLQVHGGIAFTIEHELHRYYKHVLGLEPLLGSPRALHAAIARDLLQPGDASWPAW